MYIWGKGGKGGEGGGLTCGKGFSVSAFPQFATNAGVQVQVSSWVSEFGGFGM